jgi:hypothetical protein
MSFIAVALLLLPSFPPPPSSSALLLIRIPHWPYSFNPVANTSPLLVTTNECAPPDAIDLIFPPPFVGMSTGTNVLFEDDDADDPNGIPSRKKSPFPATYASVFNVRELWFCVHFIRFFSSMEEEENVTRAPPKVAMISQS